MYPLDVAGEATDLEQLSESVRIQSQAVPLALDGRHRSQNLRTQLQPQTHHCSDHDNG